MQSLFSRESTIDMSSDDTEDDVDGDPGTTLELPPEITMVLRNRDVKEGGSTKFTCCAISRSPVTAEWYKDEQLIQKWPRFKQDQDDIMFSLNITKAKTTDAGHFKFVARNAFGEVENNAYLNVERKLLCCTIAHVFSSHILVLVVTLLVAFFSCLCLCGDISTCP